MNLTLSIEKNVLERIRKKLRVYKLSRIVEVYFQSILDPHAYCAKCGKEIPYKESPLGSLPSFLCEDHRNYAKDAPEEMHRFAMYVIQTLEKINIRRIPEGSSEQPKG